MNLLAALDDIVTKLTTDISGVNIESFPQDPVRYYRNLHRTGAILVAYDGSEFEPPDANRKRDLEQMRTIDWKITIVHRDLIEEDGIYANVENVRESLSGYTVNSLVESTVLRPIRDGSLGRDGSNWFHEMIFRHEIPEVEAFQ